MRRNIVLAVVFLSVSASGWNGASVGRADALPARVDSEILDAAGTPVTEVTVGEDVRLTATVGGDGGAPTGAVAFIRYGSADCTGESTAAATAPLVASAYAESRTADISNVSGWDSATTWIGNGVDQFASNWSGGLFAGNDNAFFASSSMAWRFNGVPLQPDDTVTRAHLSLRIRKSRPSLASEGTWTWKTVLAADTRDGSDFGGETRATFLQRFNARGAAWEFPLSAAVPDPFGTDNGITYAESPDVSDLVQARVGDAAWVSGGSIVLGLLNNRTAGIAEAEVVDQADYARLHIEWTTMVEAGEATSGPFVPASGLQSYRAQYAGDSNYAPAGGPCMSLAVLAPSVGGVAELPLPPAHSAGGSSGGTQVWLALAGGALALAATGAAAYVSRSRRAP